MNAYPCDVLPALYCVYGTCCAVRGELGLVDPSGAEVEWRSFVGCVNRIVIRNMADDLSPAVSTARFSLLFTLSQNKAWS